MHICIFYFRPWILEPGPSGPYGPYVQRSTLWTLYIYYPVDHEQRVR